MEAAHLHPLVIGSTQLLIYMNTHDLSGTWPPTKAKGGDVQIAIGAKGHRRRQVQARRNGLQRARSCQP